MESIMVLISQEIPPFSLFLFPFWEFFSLSFYTPTTMITGPARLTDYGMKSASSRFGRAAKNVVEVEDVWLRAEDAETHRFSILPSKYL
jgi:hypothetical protein